MSQLQAADAALALARRDLALASIKAPFDGEIVARSAQPHIDIGAGQAVLQIEARRTLEVVAMLPDTVAARLSLGDVASASFLEVWIDEAEQRAWFLLETGSRA